MALFEPAVAIVFKNEKGYQNNPKDTGNFNSLGENIGTNFGISAPTLEAYLGRVPSVADMKGLTKKIASDIYYAFYWRPSGFSELIDQDISNQLFDINVLQGAGKLGIIAQRALADLGYAVIQDGIFGPLTRQAINLAIADSKKTELNNSLVAERKTFLQSDYWTGWIPRAESFLTTSIDVVKKKV